jgi:hypothetical protein
MMKFGLAIAAVMLLAAAPRARAEDPGAALRCTNTGGVIETRIPEYNTNGGTPLVLAGSKQFCEYTQKKGGSHIWVLLSTLNAKLPTLAALAYYAEVPAGSCQGSPGSCYCSLIGGTDLFGGINAAGGGWVDTADTENPVLDACIFPDESIIDSYGLFYHSAGIIRGADLGKKLRYKNPY